MKPTVSPVSTVIFDLDGLLLDNEHIYLSAAQNILDHYGVTLDRAILAQDIGRPNPVVARMMVEGHGPPMTPEDSHTEREALLATLLGDSEAMPGAVALTTALAAANVLTASATSFSRETYELKALRHRAWFECFQWVVIRDDVANGKPEPDLFLRAVELFGVPPSACLVFEDALSGVEVALAAGMRVVAIPTKDKSSAAWAKADAVLSLLSEFNPVLWGLTRRS